jgi:hypothetical protein
MTTINKVLDAVYALLSGEAIEGIKTVYGPGSPVTPIRSMLPAIAIFPDSPSKLSIKTSNETKSDTYKVSLAITTEDYMTRGEQRDRGDITEMATLTEAVEAILWGAPTLSDEVFDIEQIETNYLSPGITVLTVAYLTVEGI